jgi:hypothetical protein
MSNGEAGAYVWRAAFLPNSVSQVRNILGHVLSLAGDAWISSQ